eukprot:749282-Hanusia_phi.AAC.1
MQDLSTPAATFPSSHPTSIEEPIGCRLELCGGKRISCIHLESISALSHLVAGSTRRNRKQTDLLQCIRSRDTCRPLTIPVTCTSSSVKQDTELLLSPQRLVCTHVCLPSFLRSSPPRLDPAIAEEAKYSVCNGWGY